MILRMGTEFFGCASGADFRITFVFPVSISVSSGVFQSLVFRANDAVIECIVDVFPPRMSALSKRGLTTLGGMDNGYHTEKAGT